jgi:hypothetical protein
MKRVLLSLLVLFTFAGSYADTCTVVIDNLKFLIDTQTQEAAMLDNFYVGVINVPEKITVKGTEFTVTSLGEGCFYYYGDDDFGGVTSVTVPTTVTSFGEDCFRCSALTSFTIPSSITSLPYKCFGYCEKLKSITIPNTVKSIDYRCFTSCNSLDSIVIPSSVTSLGDGCFDYSKNLKKVVLSSSLDSLKEGLFSGCTSLIDITIPSSVTFLGEDCFENCSSLSKLTIPAAVASIGDYCFSGCEALKSLTCLAVTPPKAPKAFENNGEKGDSEVETKFDPTTCVLYVPDVEAYKKAEGWSAFTNIKSLTDPTGIASVSLQGVAVSSADGRVNVSGLTEGAPVAFYSLNGKLLGKTSALNGVASLATSEDVVICKIGDKSFKVQVKH